VLKHASRSFFDRRSRAGIDLAASAITPGRQSLN
jgi:hypothetical protein